MSKDSRQISTVTLTAVVLVGVMWILRTSVASAQSTVSAPGASSVYQSHSSEEEHAHSDALHHYSSPADEANDALLITEVKAAFADDDATAGHPVVVDCDHGTIALTGVVGSPGDARHLVSVAVSQPGVEAVKDGLKW
jgi:osmotically-inducible protein OsmY